MHGVTKEVVLDVDGPSAEIKDPWGNFRMGAEATTTLNRTDFGVGEKGGAAIGEEIRITLDVEVVRKASPAAVASGASGPIPPEPPKPAEEKK